MDKLKQLMFLIKMGYVVDKKTQSIINIIGTVLIVLCWHIATSTGSISSTILPKPIDVLKSFGELYNNYDIFSNTFFSVKLNLYGYLEAILIAIPLGFIIGLFPLTRGLLSKWIDAFRFIPLTAVTGLFIAWFGIEIGMKVHFLAFGIIIYLLPVIVQRIDQTEKVHLQSIVTLGANSWQKFKYVYFPSVMSKISDDIRVLVAISWTYIIVAELINKEGGVGSLIFTATKQSRIDMVFAILIIIIIIGYFQDILFKWIDYLCFPYKYDSSQTKSKISIKKYLIK